MANDEVYTREFLKELRQKVIEGNRTKYINSVVETVKRGVIHTVTDTSDSVFIYKAPCSSKEMAEILMPRIREKLKTHFPDLAVIVEYDAEYDWWFCRRWFTLHSIQITVSWRLN